MTCSATSVSSSASDSYFKCQSSKTELLSSMNLLKRIMTKPLRIGFVPEHFSTPLYFAQKYFALSAHLVPYPSGTGHMITSLHDNEIDVAVGLTEGWVAALGKRRESDVSGFKIVGTYVESPLCWAISTGRQRDINDVNNLKERKVGVSRIGSGSHVMSFVLADTKGWLPPVPGRDPFEIVSLQTFAKLREAVNQGSADFFMWEHFTTKRYHDSGIIKRIGEIYTPWSSWKIVANDGSDERLFPMFDAMNQGIRHFLSHEKETLEYISTQLDYSKEDAREWLKTVKFPADVKGVKKETIEKTIEILTKAGVIDGTGWKANEMIGISEAMQANQIGR